MLPDRREIPLTKGYVAIVDADDSVAMSLYEWCADEQKGGLVYAMTTLRLISGKKLIIRMHRLITRAVKGEIVDHWDGDGLHNWRTNLRKVSHQANIHNQQRAKGTYFIKRANRWSSSITINGKHVYLGCFKTEADARAAYVAAKKAIGIELSAPA